MTFFKKLTFLIVLSAGVLTILSAAPMEGRVVIQEETGTAVVEESTSDSQDSLEAGTDVTEVAKKNKFDFSYYLGAEYLCAFDMPLYKNIPFYTDLRNSEGDSMFKLADELGMDGHIFRIVNNFEWRREKLSFSLFANLTMNYVPAFLNTAFLWIPACLEGAIGCASGIAALWGSALGDMLLLNVVTFFLIPIIGTVICGAGCAFCLLAIPASVVILALPMASVGGSIDYHPYTDNLIDTKVSLGLDVDLYRGILHAGFAGLFLQCEASANYKRFRLYSQAGYRVDVINVLATVQTGKGTVDQPCRYVPAPYMKAGIAFKL